MPCWQTNRLIYEQMTVRPEIFAKAVKGIKQELAQMGGHSVIHNADGNTFTIQDNRTRDIYTVDLNTGNTSYRAKMKDIHHLVKRNYSLAAVQTVANRSQVFRTFKMTKINDRKIILVRR
jgi:hypothetical protein